MRDEFEDLLQQSISEFRAYLKGLDGRHVNTLIEQTVEALKRTRLDYLTKSALGWDDGFQQLAWGVLDVHLIGFAKRTSHKRQKLEQLLYQLEDMLPEFELTPIDAPLDIEIFDDVLVFFDQHSPTTAKVLRLWAGGVTIPEIAAKLKLSSDVIVEHFQEITRQMHVEILYARLVEHIYSSPSWESRCGEKTVDEAQVTIRSSTVREWTAKLLKIELKTAATTLELIKCRLDQQSGLSKDNRQFLEGQLLELRQELQNPDPSARLISHCLNAIYQEAPAVFDAGQ